MLVARRVVRPVGALSDKAEARRPEVVDKAAGRAAGKAVGSLVVNADKTRAIDLVLEEGVIE